MYTKAKEMVVQVVKWGDSLAVRLPAAVVDALELREGDEIEIRISGERTFDIERNQRREEALEHIRSFHKKLPPDWKFDREKANER
jgi:antitoxin MazE